MSAPRELPPPDPPMDEVDQYRMPLLDHLRELRNRMLRAVAALAIGMGVSLLFTDEILAFLTDPVRTAVVENGIEGGLSIVNSPFEGIYVWLKAAFIGALALSSPVIAFEIWGFVAPGLYKTERRMVVPLAASSTFLFLLGAGFAYYAIFPLAFPFFFTVIDAEVSLSVDGYLSAVLKMMLAFGACFQMPVGTFFLARLGLIDHRDMTGAFRYAIVGIFVVAAIITPPDVLTQTMLAIPLCILYFFSIGIAWMFTTKDRAALEG